MYLNCNQRLNDLAMAHAPSRKTPNGWSLLWGTEDRGTGTVWLVPLLTTDDDKSNEEYALAKQMTDMSPVDTKEKFIILPIPAWTTVSSDDDLAFPDCDALPVDDALAMARAYASRLKCVVKNYLATRE